MFRGCLMARAFLKLKLPRLQVVDVSSKAKGDKTRLIVAPVSRTLAAKSPETKAKLTKKPSESKPERSMKTVEVSAKVKILTLKPPKERIKKAESSDCSGAELQENEKSLAKTKSKKTKVLKKAASELSGTEDETAGGKIVEAKRSEPKLSKPKVKKIKVIKKAVTPDATRDNVSCDAGESDGVSSLSASPPRARAKKKRVTKKKEEEDDLNEIQDESQGLENGAAETDESGGSKISTSNSESLLTHIKTFPLFIVQNKKVGGIFEPSLWSFSPVLKDLLQKLPKEPSVTKILSETMPEESRLALKRWEVKMIAKLGLQGFQKLKKDNFENGKNFHQCIAEHLQNGTDFSELELHHVNQGLWDSISPLFDHISDVRLVETTVTHPLLGYTGIFDCLACYRNQLVVIDWKTSERFKPKLEHAYDDPVQLVAYLGALKHSPLFDIKVNGALLAICYKNGRQAHMHYLSPELCQHYWQIWLERLRIFWTTRLKDESPPVLQSVA